MKLKNFREAVFNDMPWDEDEETPRKKFDGEDLEEDDGGYSANLHEEHLQEAIGIQAPKYN